MYARANILIFEPTIGGHQMDLRPDADWSDPYVIAG